MFWTRQLKTRATGKQIHGMIGPPARNFMMRTRVALLAALLLPLLANAETTPNAGERFVGMYDVSFQPFPNATRVDPKSPAEIVRYEEPAKKWTLVFTRSELASPLQLHDTKDVNGADRAGYLSSAVAALRSGDATAEVFRNEIVDFGELRVGLITATAKPDGQPTLQQQAVIAITPRLYYGLVMTSPFSGGDPQEDKSIGEAVEAFKGILGSLEPVNLSQIRQEQEDRLIRTRALFVNWTRPRLLAALVPERMLRLRQDGRDVGYAYVVEEPAIALPKKGVAREPIDAKTATGLRVGMRLRTTSESGKDVQIESWMFVSFDRKHEVWSTTTIATDPKATSQKDREQWRLELGTSDMVEDRVFDEKLKPEELKQIDQRNAQRKKGAPEEVPFRVVDKMRLTVRTEQRSGALPEIKKEVPPFYLQQAIGTLLPRLLPLGEPNSYAFASYSSEGRQIMMRYVDVSRESEVTIGGKRVRAISITDRLGYEGQPITHYVSPQGEYLGTFNPISKLEITPTDRDTLAGIWKNAELSAPTVQ
jgi:hypothetical protein